MFPFTKLLKLPSNGLEYDAFVELKPLTNAFFFAFQETQFKTNIAETKATLLKPYLSINPFEMWYADLLFVWEYVMSYTFEQTEITKKEFCRNCRQENEVAVANESLDIAYLEDKNPLSIVFDYNGSKMQVDYRRRKTIDNVRSSLDNFELQDALEDPTNYIKFFSKLFQYQITSITFDNNYYTNPSEKELFDLISYADAKETLINLLYDKLFKNNDFGILNNFNYICKHCNHHNDLLFFDPLSDSLYIKNANAESSNMYHLEIVKEGFLTFSELMALPISMNKDFFEKCTKVLEKESELASGKTGYRNFHGLK